MYVELCKRERVAFVGLGPSWRVNYGTLTLEKALQLEKQLRIHYNIEKMVGMWFKRKNLDYGCHYGPEEIFHADG